MTVRSNVPDPGLRQQDPAPPGRAAVRDPDLYYGRSFDEGKKITWRDGVLAVGALLRFRFLP